ncbi:MAG: CHAT domain-containing protein [Coleofasciculaceae cyanobacterium]
MKSVARKSLIISQVSFLLTIIPLALTISVKAAQSTTPTAQVASNNYLAQTHLLLSETSNLTDMETALDQDKVAEAVPLIEQTWEKQYEDYFGIDLSDQSIDVKEIANTLSKITTQTQRKPALLYVVPREQQLELVLITPEGKPIHKRVSPANEEALLKQVQNLTDFVSKPELVNTEHYLPSAQQLYQWIIAPLEADLQAHNINTLIFCLGGGLRTMPLAALHDGQKFLVENYSLAVIPAFKLTDTVYTELKNSQVLAMGASEFRNQPPLPGVSVELSNIVKELWSGKLFINEEFTLANLLSQRHQNPYRIVHLATHAEFQPGEPSNSYIQFWDSKLTLAQMRELQWDAPQVELLVLSACRTALGDQDAELGFAGLAIQAKVKSALASLWYVSDEGTLGLMTEFYRNLKTAPIKVEALQQAQIAMLKGKLPDPEENISRLPVGAALETTDFSHPYYWAAFTVVGNAW